MLLKYALTRRGLALEQANIMNFHRHDELVEKLFEYCLKTVMQGFSQVTLKQLEQADQRFFTLTVTASR